MAENVFRAFNLVRQGIARDFISVTPSDTVDLKNGAGVTAVAMGLFIGTGGVLNFETEAGYTRQVTVPGNFKLEVGVTRVNATGTTASNIFAYMS